MAVGLAGIVGIALSGAAGADARDLVNYDATVSEWSHGLLILRSFKDCQEHIVVGGAKGQTKKEMSDMDQELRDFGAKHGTNVHVWIQLDQVKGMDHPMERVVAIDSIKRTDSADARCVKVLGTKTARGVAKQCGQGNGGGGCTLLTDDGKELIFDWRNSNGPQVTGGSIFQIRSGLTKLKITYKELSEGKKRSVLATAIAILP